MRVIVGLAAPGSWLVLAACSQKLAPADRVDAAIIDGSMIDGPMIDGPMIDGPMIDAPPTCVPNGTTYPPAGYTLGGMPTLVQVWQESTGQPIGSALAQVRITRGTYETYSFTRASFPGTDPVYEFNADTSNVGGGGAVGADTRYVAISECAGDLRVASPGAVDPTLQAPCRVYATEGPFLYLNFGAPRVNMCNLDPTKTYVFNVIFDDPSDGYNAAQSCNTALDALSCAFRMNVFPRQ